MRSLLICRVCFTPNKYSWGGQIEEDEMKEEFRTHGRDEKCTQNFNQRIWKEKTNRIVTIYGVSLLTRFQWPRIGSSGGCCEHCFKRQRIACNYLSDY